MNYRKEWFNWVGKERKRLQRKNKAATHKQAMAAASITWPKQKAKIKRKADREARKSQKAAASAKVAPPKESVTSSSE